MTARAPAGSRFHFSRERGRFAYAWMLQPGRRNELLDCRVYAMAAARHPKIAIDRMTPTRWTNLARLRGVALNLPPTPAHREITPPPVELSAPREVVVQEQPLAPATVPVRRHITPPPRQSGFVGRY